MKRRLANAGITTSALALGCARIGSVLTPLTRQQCLRLIGEAYDLGIRHFDTASIYGQGDSERYLGSALASHREEVCISSKAGQKLSTMQALTATMKTPLRWLSTFRSGVRTRVAQQRTRGMSRCFEPDYIAHSLQQSLRRLRVDHLDIFYLHSPDVSVLHDEALLERLERLQRAGQFRALGISCDEIAVASEAASLPMVQVLQFAFDDTAEMRFAVDNATKAGKDLVLRGFAPGSSSQPERSRLLVRRFAQALELPAFGGAIVGTTNPAHLKENIAAFHDAMAFRGFSR